MSIRHPLLRPAKSGGAALTGGRLSRVRMAHIRAERGELRGGMIPRQLTAVGKTLYFEEASAVTSTAMSSCKATAPPGGCGWSGPSGAASAAANISNLTVVGKTLLPSASDGVHGTRAVEGRSKAAQEGQGQAQEGLGTLGAVPSGGGCGAHRPIWALALRNEKQRFGFAWKGGVR